MLIGVNADDAQGTDFTFLEHLLGMLDAMISDLGDVDQPFDVALQAGERAELGQARDHAFHKLTHAELFHARFPGIIGQRADREPDAFLLTVNVDDLDLDLLPHLQHLARMLHAIPRKLGEMNQAVGAIDVDEGPKIGEAGHAARVDLADFQLLDHALLDGVTRLPPDGAYILPVGVSAYRPNTTLSF